MTVDVTMTVYDVKTLMSDGKSTSTVYTRTVTVNDIQVSTKTDTETVNATVSVAATKSMPAFPGYTPLAVQHSSANARFIAESDGDWAVEDEYWNKDSSFVAEEVMCNRGWYATATSRHDIPAQTLTRTRFWKQSSTTRTVWVSPTSAPTIGAQQLTIFTELTVTSSWATYMEATTVTLTVSPSTRQMQGLGGEMRHIWKDLLVTKCMTALRL